MNIIVLGPPGSGKGTHSKTLSKYFKAPVYGAGELLRKAAKKDKKIRRILDLGKLVPAKIVDSLIKKKVKAAKKGVIIEGYPREANRLMLLKKYFKPDIVVFLNISPKEAARRLGGRRICEHCGKVYHLVYKKPNKYGICDVCGGRLIRRHDETPQAIKQRISIFQKETTPVIRWYKKQRLVLEINGNNKSIKEVSKELITKLKIWKKSQ
jgi:adenylate kinase